MDRSKLTITKCYWHELDGNVLNINIKPEMITDGYKLVRADRLKGMLRRDPKILLEITYDRDYVVAYLAKKFTQPLNQFKWNDLMIILKDAYSQKDVN